MRKVFKLLRHVWEWIEHYHTLVWIIESVGAAGVISAFLAALLKFLHQQIEWFLIGGIFALSSFLFGVALYARNKETDEKRSDTEPSSTTEVLTEPPTTAEQAEQKYLDESDITLSDSLELTSPSEIEVHLKISKEPGAQTDGVLINIVNRNQSTLDSWRVVVESFRSFDSRRRIFRPESAGSAEVGRFGAVRPDWESGGYWLLRINGQSEQLEIGNTVGKGALQWPPKDAAVTQKWLLTVRLEGNLRTDKGPLRPLPMWTFSVCIEWTKPNILKVGRPPQ